MKIRQFALAVILIGAILCAGCTPAEPAATTTVTSPATTETSEPTSDVYNLYYGAGASTSGYFVWHVALSKVVDKYLPNINLTVIETGATIDDLNGLRDGYWDIAGHGGDVPTLFEIIRGEPPSFEGKAYPEARLFWARSSLWFSIVVTEDSGITKVAELDGKAFCPGYTGSNAAKEFQRVAATLGIEPDFYYADWADALKALSDGHIVGVYKSSTWGAIDSSLKEVSLTKPLNIIGFSEEEAETLVTEEPFYTDEMIIHLPKGTVADYPDAGDFWVDKRVAVQAASPRLPQEIGYQIVKAWHQHHDEVVAAFPKVGEEGDPMDLLMQCAPKDSEMKLHAGVVQYAKELGLDVDPSQIPPEYQEP